VLGGVGCAAYFLGSQYTQGIQGVDMWRIWHLDTPALRALLSRLVFVIVSYYRSGSHGSLFSCAWWLVTVLITTGHVHLTKCVVHVCVGVSKCCYVACRHMLPCFWHGPAPFSHNVHRSLAAPLWFIPSVYVVEVL
jgi:hypothetical protein